MGGDAFDEVAEEDEIDVGVEKAAVRGLGGGLGAGDFNGACGAFPVVGAAESGAESGVVGHELADGDGFLAVAFEFGEVAGDGVVDAEFFPVDEFHDRGGGGDDFGE